MAGHLDPPDIDAADLAVQHHVLTYFGFALLVNLLMAVRRMLGVRYLWAMTLGRYRRPTEEERIVAFMDLKGSTPLAERLGPARYHDFLNDVSFDVADAITESGGEVINMSATRSWSPGRPGAASRGPIASPLSSRSKMRWPRGARPSSPDYGAEPRLRGALHIGPLMVGEIGDLKRQIVMIGDTMNTAARIEGACRKFGREYRLGRPDAPGGRIAYRGKGRKPGSGAPGRQGQRARIVRADAGVGCVPSCDRSYG